MSTIIAFVIAIVLQAVGWSFGYWVGFRTGRRNCFRKFVTGSDETYRALGEAREDYARFAAGVEVDRAFSKAGHPPPTGRQAERLIKEFNLD
jgi:hypothetical protein